MSAGSKIEWTDATWNPVTGCDHVSPGCDNCYAERIATRFGRPFIGAVECHEDRLDAPLRWRKPRRVFVNSVSDLFHPLVDDLFLARVFAVMSLTPNHAYQVLTKRQKQLRILDDEDWRYKVSLERMQLSNAHGIDKGEFVWPLPNVWLGVSVENQRYADLRIPHLLAASAAVRFLSIEPLLGPVSIARHLGCADPAHRHRGNCDRVRWVIVGGESGPGARPMHPQWARTIRDQCVNAGVPYFFKQWGEWLPSSSERENRENSTIVKLDGKTYPLSEPGPWSEPSDAVVNRVGKTRAGRVLDGRTWDEYPTEAK